MIAGVPEKEGYYREYDRKKTESSQTQDNEYKDQGSQTYIYFVF